MKQIIAFLSAIALTVLLTACGGTEPQEAPLLTAALMQAETAGDQGAAQGNSAAMPQPDCAPEGCNGLRIINGNAEAYRADQMEREKLVAAANQGT